MPNLNDLVSLSPEANAYDERVCSAIRDMLEPVVRLASTEFRLPYPAVEELTKQLYLRVAKETEPEITPSELVAKTGLSKRDVIEHADLDRTAEATAMASVEGKVLEAWHQSEEFVDENGAKEIQVRGAGNTFQQLVRKVVDRSSGYADILLTLQEAGSVELVHRQRPRRVRLLKNSFKASTSDKLKRLEVQSQALKSFGSTLVNNVRVDELPFDEPQLKLQNTRQHPAVTAAYEVIASGAHQAKGDEDDNPNERIQTQFMEDVPESLVETYELGQKRILRHCLTIMRLWAHAEWARLEERKQMDPSLSEEKVYMVGSGFYTSKEAKHQDN